MLRRRQDVSGSNKVEDIKTINRILLLFQEARTILLFGIKSILHEGMSGNAFVLFVVIVELLQL